jgi:succinoglycan biosynthesis protein ExoU
VSATRPTAVIITAKDAATTCARAVASALAQAPTSEVVFVDDGSADATSAAAAAADDGSGRLKIVRLNRNRGPAHGRNVAVEASSAPFLCILDADDFMAAGRLDRLYQKGGEDWDLLADNMLFTSGATEDEVFDRLLTDDFKLPCELTLSAFVNGNLRKNTRYRRELGFLKPVIRRSFLAAHGLRYDERLRLAEDFLLYAGCLLEGAVFRIVDACGYYATERRESLSVEHATHHIAALYQALVELEARAVSRGRSVGTLPQYTRATRNNLALRRALDAKRAGGWPAFLAACGSAPSSLAYIASELARANIPGLAGRRQ